MALHRRDLVSDINSFNSQIASDIGITTSAGEEVSSTISIKSTTSSDPPTTSANTASTVKSTASSMTKSADSTSSSAKSATASTITSSSSTASKSLVTSSSRSSFSSSQSPSSITHSSTVSTSTQTTTLTSSSTPTPTSSVLPTTSTASGNTISTVGLVIAVIFALLILSGVLYLLWKYLPAARRYRERAYIARSHRDGLSFSDPRKGLTFTDEESTHEVDLQLDDPKLGLGLRELDFHAAPTYYPGEPDSYALGLDADRALSQRRPLTSASSELDHIVSPLSSTRSTRSQFSRSTLPSALQAGPTSHMRHPLHHQYRYQDLRTSRIGVAVPLNGGGNGNENSRPGSREKGLPPVPLPSIGYGRPFS